LGSNDEARQRRVIFIIYVISNRLLQAAKDILGGAQNMRKEIRNIPELTLVSEEDVISHRLIDITYHYIFV
jgi:hypothetical protein